MRPAVEAEKVGIPAVVVTTTGFTTIAKAAAKAEGMNALRIAEYPGAVGVHPEELVVENVTNVLFDRIVEALTRPVNGEAAQSSGSGRLPNEIIYEGTFDEVNDYFRTREWTDELPIVPPTIERVEAFLKHTDRSPAETIAVLPQANLAAVPWNIAANAVMAGCRPDCMPLLIAAVEAIADNAYNLNNIGSTWGVLPFLLINGPAIEKMGIESGGQLISKGGNPAIGRALGLIIKNIAGYKLGRNYMGTFGYPTRYEWTNETGKTVNSNFPPPDECKTPSCTAIREVAKQPAFATAQGSNSGLVMNCNEAKVLLSTVAAMKNKGYRESSAHRVIDRERNFNESEKSELKQIVSGIYDNNLSVSQAYVAASAACR